MRDKAPIMESRPGVTSEEKLEARVGIEPLLGAYLLTLQDLKSAESIEIVRICRIPYNFV